MGASGGTVVRNRLKTLVQAGLLGYGFLRAWIVLFLSFARQSTPGQSWGSAVLLAALAAMALGAFFLMRAPSFERREKVCDTLLLMAGLVGSCCAFFGFLLGHGAYLAMGLLLVGLCGGYFEVRWMMRFLAYAQDKAYGNILLAFLVAAVLGIAFSLLPDGLILVESWGLLAAMGVLYFFAPCDDGAVRGAERTSGAAAPSFAPRWSRPLARVVLTCFLFSFIQLAATGIGYGSLPSGDVFGARFTANLISALALVAIFLFRGSISPFGLLKAILPITAAGLFLQIVDINAYGTAPIVVLLIGNKLFDFLMLMVLMRLIWDGSIHPTLGLSFFVAAKNVGNLVGQIAGEALLAHIGTDPVALSLFVGSLVVLLIVAFLWVLSDHSLSVPPVSDAVRSVEEPAAAFGIEERARLLAETHGLTPRETEILSYLARGKNREAIAAEQCVSKSTVHTHMIHIYQKLGVHNQQEVIVLVEEMECPAA